MIHVNSYSITKHHPRKEIQEKEMVVLSEKGKEISIKTAVASSSMKPFEDRPYRT